MHDTVHLERKGIPTVAIAHDAFEKAARTQAKAMGLPSARIVVIPTPKHGDDKEHLRKLAEQAFPQVLKYLVE